ncbi:uncharacterized protein LOC124457525 [Xenia sp. Carnegie-2017]|uniref:uncharacterized protein LOC124457525 n=1 Tax=Xenia sp. Carnegie-2017 TaxID=2897299 RepID=UPI001F03FBEE|nr:uncharacterized protein LOC124457525 [Xenia sp. Carnegie-2017]
MMSCFVGVEALLTLSLLFSVSVKANRNAFSSDIKSCLFDDWFSNKGILKTEVDCSGPNRSGLCYGESRTLFAVCYNNETLIPEFTGHVVEANIMGSGRSKWINENGPFAPAPQSKMKDYSADKRYDGSYNAGHLTPNGDFGKDERKFTMVNTNSAPQWKHFNGVIWKKLEQAVRTYAKKNNKQLYVVTGTGGQLKYENGTTLELNERVLIPRYFWKAICDPSGKQSVAVIAENPIYGENNSNREILYPYSLKELKEKYPELNLPSLQKVNASHLKRQIFDSIKETYKVA